LNMIVDLESNDVARICLPGTRKVTQPRTVGTYPTVFRAVATERYSRCEDRDMERKIRTYQDSDLWWRGIGRVEDVYKST
jgi:hypothetical protein